MDQVRTMSNVIPLWRQRDPKGCPVVARLGQIWESLRRDSALPDREALTPAALSDILPNAFLIDRVRPGLVRFRVAGQHLSQVMGMDVRGMPLRAFMEITDRKRLMENVESVFETCARLDMGLVSDAQGRATLTGRMVLLPVTGPEGKPDRALGVLVTEGLIGLTPRRFRIRHLALSPLGTDPALARDPSSQNPGTAGRPSLRVITGGLA